jgi:hypothetical protein
MNNRPVGGRGSETSLTPSWSINQLAPEYARLPESNLSLHSKPRKLKTVSITCWIDGIHNGVSKF